MSKLRDNLGLWADNAHRWKEWSRPECWRIEDGVAVVDRGAIIHEIRFDDLGVCGQDRELGIIFMALHAAIERANDYAGWRWERDWFYGIYTEDAARVAVHKPKKLPHVVVEDDKEFIEALLEAYLKARGVYE